MRQKIPWVIASIISPVVIWAIHHAYAYITPPSLLYIPNSTKGDILSELTTQGVPLNILHYRLFKRYDKPEMGWVRFDADRRMTREEFVQSLAVKPRVQTRRIVMYSSDNIEEFSTKVAKQTRLRPASLLAQYRHYSPYPDGGILAGFYQIPYSATPSAIIYYMVMESERIFEQIADEWLGGYDAKEWQRILTIASIIQKETFNTIEMPLVSSVIHNRLAQGLKLQMDASLNYGKYSHQPITPERIRRDKSRYNTYRHKGLPSRPIGSASKAAILAAINPTKTNYLYFMLNRDGRHDFSATYAEHLQNIRIYKATEANSSAEPSR